MARDDAVDPGADDLVRVPVTRKERPAHPAATPTGHSLVARFRATMPRRVAGTSSEAATAMLRCRGSTRTR